MLRVSGNGKQDLQRMQRMHGRTIVALRSRGKHFLVEFDGFALRVHFMPFGSYRINERREAALGCRNHLGRARRRAFFCEHCQTLYRDADQPG